MVELTEIQKDPKGMPNLESALSKDYWTSLTKRYPDVASAIRIRHCYSWINAALRALDEDGLSNKFKVGYVQEFPHDKSLQKNFGIWQHVWLEVPTVHGLYISDGTAAQIDPVYVDGFYGLLSECSKRLKNVYEYRNRSS
ncbi:hypothetical protein HYW20_07210 [Candidatus Woesearchaeota archaeon]|nr:hypothetical protein [Candidatus Woesearchaeota archaeon]